MHAGDLIGTPALNKLALALLYERRYECPGAAPILAVHGEIVIECDTDKAEVKPWLVSTLKEGMDEFMNADGHHVPIAPAHHPRSLELAETLSEDVVARVRKPARRSVKRFGPSSSSRTTGSPQR